MRSTEKKSLCCANTNVMMLVSDPKLDARTVDSFVETTQAVPIILKVLGFNPRSLDAVRVEGTPVLLDLGFNEARER